MTITSHLIFYLKKIKWKFLFNSVNIYFKFKILHLQSNKPGGVYQITKSLAINKNGGFHVLIFRCNFSPVLTFWYSNPKCIIKVHFNIYFWFYLSCYKWENNFNWPIHKLSDIIWSALSYSVIIIMDELFMLIYERRMGNSILIKFLSFFFLNLL